MLLRRLAVLLAGCCMCAVSLRAANTRTRAELADSVRLSLASARTPSDSIHILYNLYDLASYNERFDKIKELHEVAVRAHNVKVQLDVLRHWANIAVTMHNDSLARRALELVEELPESEDQRQTRSFIKACVYSSKLVADEEERSSRIHRLLTELSEKPLGQDAYEDVERLFALTHAISGVTQGALLSEYLDKLDHAIERLPETESMALRNKFYTDAAIAYWRNDEPLKSLEADRKLMEIIDKMEQDYHARGRIYRNLDVHRYIIIRRMLRNYKELSVTDVNLLKNRIVELAENNPDIRADYYETNPMARAIVMVKHGDYRSALPLVKQLAENAGDVYDRRYFLSMFRDVADKAGDLEMQKEADYAYITSLEEYIRYKSGERMRELHILYDVNDLRRQALDSQLDRQRSVALVSLVAAIVLVLLLIPLVVFYLKLRRKSRLIESRIREVSDENAKLKAGRDSLVAERDNALALEKSTGRLIDYMCHEVVTPLSSVVEYSQMIIDNVQGENKEYMKRFFAVVQMNVNMVREIMGDVQEYKRLENREIQIRRAPVNVNEFCRMLTDSVRPLAMPGVQMRYVPDTSPHPVVNLDSRHLGVVIMTLMSTSAKFTEKGAITLEARVSDDGSEAVFIMSDTGVSIPREMAAKVFEQFNPMEMDTKGSGLGLPVCARLAQAMGGTLEVDTSYPGPGARFVLTVPVKNPSSSKE